MWRTRIYSIWRGMKQRCEDPNSDGYRRYGARGICLCEEWHDPIVFINWALSHGYRDNLSIDRIDNAKGYSPDNCRWADAKTQGRNQTTNHIIEYLGEKRCITEWSEITGIPVPTIWGRLHRGWPVNEALTLRAPTRKKNPDNNPIVVTYNGVSGDLKYWSSVTGISANLLRDRISKKEWDVERALTQPVQVKRKKQVCERAGEIVGQRA